ncbi:HEPN domain-containing protein [Bacillus paralicheniformis]|uniref:HEPN domain-containing protein n=1 Tax=Bacillus paralicheniformis TaxID=1648923 RepID=UPI00128E70C4|nr:HEPN domain-containing protein [Bacillus paralicheniformis]MPQ27118.1 hypothetical protein [Bacillus paralicheniformis]
MQETVVDKLYEDNKSLLKFLEENSEISFQQDMDNKLKKILIVCSASYFEKEITDLLKKYFILKTGENNEIVSFLSNKAINRQYHTYFDWNGNNINKFLGLFGEKFKQQSLEEIQKKELTPAIKAFLTLGELRNQLVHNNMATHYIEQTNEEVYDLYKQALRLILYFQTKFC